MSVALGPLSLSLSLSLSLQPPSSTTMPYFIIFFEISELSRMLSRVRKIAVPAACDMQRGRGALHQAL